MHFLKLLTLCASAALANPLSGAPSGGDDTPSNRDVRIRSVTWNGSGCHMGSTTSAGPSPADTAFVLSSDLKTLTIIYSKYYAQANINGQPDIPRTNCLINIQVIYPPT